MTTITLTPDPASFPSLAALSCGAAAAVPQRHARRPLPRAASTVPPRRCVPEFRPIRRGAGGSHRVQQAVRHRPAVLLTGLLAAAAAIAAGPLRPGLPAPAVPASTQTAAGQASSPHCPSGR